MITTPTNNIITLDTIEEKSIKYISLLDFCKANDLKYSYYESKEKFEITYKNNKLYFSPLSSYMKINSKSYHMLYPTLFKNNVIFVPVITFYKILEKEKLPTQLLNAGDKHIKALTNIYNINDITINNKKNGISIILNTSEHFPQKNIATSISREGWLNITIINGSVDSLGIKKSQLSYPIIKSHTIQSNQSAQISFLCKNKVDDISIISNKRNIEILLSTQQNSNSKKIQEIRKKWIIDTIVIDAGHGGKDPGAIGINKLQEKTVALDIARQLGKMLERNLNVKVVYTRDKDVFIPLWKRTQIANNSGGDIFISIHANSTSKSSKIKGFETFLLRVGKTDDAIDVAKRENSVIALEDNSYQYANLSDAKLIVATMAQNSAMKASEDLADIIQQQMSKKIQSKDRGVKQAGFQVLVGASMPNVLVEVGFLSNPSEASQLGKAKHRREIAKALYNAIEEFRLKYEKE
mgnify:CR=1 FL=1